MAKRFVYIPIEEFPYVKSIEVEFVWEPGMAMSQRQKSSANFHNEIRRLGLASRILECSRASLNELGVKLSAFNLPYYLDTTKTVENIYQGSKVFKHKTTGEEIWLSELFNASSMEAKLSPILKDTNYELVKFRLPDGTTIKTTNRHVFYNYIYIMSLGRYATPEIAHQLMSCDAFTDTMLKWYDGRVTACQAHATAMCVGMARSGTLDSIMNDKDNYFKLFEEDEIVQLRL